MKNNATHRRPERSINNNRNMWLNLVVMVSVFRVIRMLFNRHRPANLRHGPSSLLNLTVARVIYQSLRIPDTGGRGFQVLDALLLTDREIYVFSIQTLSGTVRIRDDGTWLETDLNGNAIVHPNMVAQLHEKVAVLADYISRRGVTVPPDVFKPRVVFVDPTASPEQEILLQPEVLSYDRYEDIQKNISAANVLGIQSSISATSKIIRHQQLEYILCTAPTWDRIELRGGGSLFGEFLSFKGTTSDLQALGAAKRSKVKQYEALHTWNFWSLFGVHTVAEVVVVCTMRDYRQDGSAQPAKVEARVRGDLEIVFRVDGSSKPRSFELKDISVISLRA